ncbi:hypothetical protein MXB_4682 [Myxobolus squamalis]|nr:hypothetical protein MXB_4682 [Myxobolus squamalis]
MGSENPCRPLSGELNNPTAYSHARARLGRKPDILCFRVIWELNPLKTLSFFSN